MLVYRNFPIFYLQIGISLGPLGAIPAATLDHNITAIGDIPQPPIMGNVDPSKIDEIRRTVYVGNLNSQVSISITEEYVNKKYNCLFCHLCIIAVCYILSIRSSYLGLSHKESLGKLLSQRSQ